MTLLSSGVPGCLVEKNINQVAVLEQAFSCVHLLLLFCTLCLQQCCDAICYQCTCCSWAKDCAARLQVIHLSLQAGMTSC